MTDHSETLHKMMSIWNSDKAEDIERITHEIMETNIHFVDPNYNIMGREAFIQMVHEVQAKIPGADYSHVGNIGEQHNHYRYHWAIHMGKELIMQGFDVTELNDQGRVVKVIGFFGELNPAT